MPDLYIHGTEPTEQERLAGLNRRTNAAFLEFLRVPAGTRVLEVGGGLGILAADVASAAPDVHVVAWKCRRRRSRPRPRIRVCRTSFGDAHTLSTLSARARRGPARVKHDDSGSAVFVWNRAMAVR